MSFPPSWIVTNFQRCCHPGILLANFADIIVDMICQVMSSSLFFWSRDLIMFTKRRACPGASAVVSPLTWKMMICLDARGDIIMFNWDHFWANFKKSSNFSNFLKFGCKSHFPRREYREREFPSLSGYSPPHWALLCLAGTQPPQCLAVSSLLLLDFHLSYHHHIFIIIIIIKIMFSLSSVMIHHHHEIFIIIFIIIIYLCTINPCFLNS